MFGQEDPNRERTMTWVEMFDRLASAHSGWIVQSIVGTGSDDQAHPGDILDEMFARYRAEGCPALDAPLPADLIFH